MSEELTSRETLRSEIQQFQDAQLFCTSLTTSSTRAVHDFSLDSFPADSEAKSGSEQLKVAFEKAMQILFVPNWNDFTGNCISTVKAEPIQFAEAVTSGAYDHIRSELSALIELGQGFVEWLGNAANCIKDLGVNISDPDKILESEVCKPFHETAKLIKEFQSMIVELESLGFMGVIELISECFSYVTEIILEILVTGLTVLGEKAASVRVWLENTAKSALSLGKLIGNLLGSLLIELGTSGLGRAIKSTKIINKLPDVDSLPIINLNDINEHGSENFIQLRISKGITKSEIEKELDILIDIFRTILNKNGKRFSRNLTATKIKILKKHLDTDSFNSFIKNHKELEIHVAESIQDKIGNVGKYKDLVKEGREISHRSLAYIYANNLVGDAIPDEFGIMFQKHETLSSIFEANHIVEQRIFKSGKEKWKKEFAKLGWETEKDMTAVLLTADEHTSNLRKMLHQQMMPDGVPIDKDSMDAALKLLEELDTTIPSSITKTLMKEINIDHHNSFSEILVKYANVYAREAPKAWEKSLAKTFKDWFKTLDYDNSILPSIPKPK